MGNSKLIKTNCNASNREVVVLSSLVQISEIVDLLTLKDKVISSLRPITH